MEWYYVLAACIIWGVCGYLLGKYQERVRWNNSLKDKYIISSNDWYSRAAVRAMFNEFCKLHNIHWLDSNTQKFFKYHNLHDDEV